MIVMLCVDKRMGMFFNRRRQSQDCLLREDILAEAVDRRLWMNAYSYQQFAGLAAENIYVDEAFLDKAETGDCCFVENQLLSAYQAKIEQIILYHWNRSYPADLYLDICLPGSDWHLQACSEFPGSSHEKITKEVYRR